MLNNAPIDVISARMVTVTKGMRILQHKLHELWEKYRLRSIDLWSTLSLGF